MVIGTDDGSECDDWDICLQCRQPVESEDDEGRFLHPECREDYEESQAERAHESWLSDCYGGDRPCTQEERYQAAAAEKRAMR